MTPVCASCLISTLRTAVIGKEKPLKDFRMQVWEYKFYFSNITLATVWKMGWRGGARVREAGEETHRTKL